MQKEREKEREETLPTTSIASLKKMGTGEIDGATKPLLVPARERENLNDEALQLQHMCSAISAFKLVRFIPLKAQVRANA